MIQLLKIRVSGYRMLDDNFEISFMPKARISPENDDDDSNTEIMEIATNLYVFKMLALTGSNASGKTTTLDLISKTLNFMKTGRWNNDNNDFSKENIELHLEFFRDNEIYLCDYVISPIRKSFESFMESPFSRITYEHISYSTYKSYAGKHYEDKLTYEELNTPTGLEDTSQLFFLCSYNLYTYNMSSVESNVMSINQKFLDSLNKLDFNLTCSIIQLLDESIEYILYTEQKTIVFKRFDEDKKTVSKHDLSNLLSNGTIKGIILYINVISLLKTGGILLIDEIENCFNKNLVNNVFFLLEDNILNKKNAMIVFSTHYIEILDVFNRRDNILIMHKKNKKIIASNLYSEYKVRTELLKSKQFNNNTFNTLLNYDSLMNVKKGIKNEISNND